MYGNYGNAQRTPYDDRFYTPRASAASVSSQRSNDRFYTPRTARSQGSNRSQMSLATARSNLSSASENTYKTTRSTFSSPSHYFNRPPTNPANTHSDMNRPISALDREMDLEAASLSIQHPTSPVHRPRTASQHSNRQSNTHQAQERVIKDIFSLARHARVSDVEELLIRGIPITSRDDNGNGILSIGCQQGSKRIAKLALRFGADINEQNESGSTPLHYCSLYQKTSLAEYLIKKGADTTIRNNEGQLY
ncbi:ankyrin repeat domain-containing protein, partial [Skeletonema marinoi]